MVGSENLPSSTHRGLGSNLWDDAIYGLSLLLVLFLAQSFALRCALSFPSTLKPTLWIFKFQFDPERYTQVGTLLILILTLLFIYFYSINTNEIPDELSHENLISFHVKITWLLSSHVKISPLLWLHKLHLSLQKTIKVKWFGNSLVFI